MPQASRRRFGLESPQISSTANLVAAGFGVALARWHEPVRYRNVAHANVFAERIASPK